MIKTISGQLKAKAALIDPDRYGRSDTSQIGRWFWEIDKVLLLLITVLIAIGLIAVAAASPAAGHRYSGGNVSYFSPPNAASTNPSGRNDGGASVGFYTTQGSSIRKGFILQGSTFTSFTHPKAVHGTVLTANNKYNSTVGYFFDSANITHGFKRYSNGSFRILQFNSGTIDTIPNGINDYGTIVGWYNTQHGFIFHNNAWATLDYPNARSLRKCPRSTIPTKLKR